MNRENTPHDGTRRRFLRATGLAGLAAGLGVPAAGQETTTTAGTTTPEGDATPILLGGEVDYWYGLAPGAIQGRENPTMRLRADERYRLVWMNLDGAPHAFVIEDDGGEALVRTETARDPGGTRSVTFTAREAMAEYYCEFHPQSMRGDVTLGEGFATETETTAPTETGTATTTTADGGAGY